MPAGKNDDTPAASVKTPTQLESAVCHGGIRSTVLQPLPVPSQTVSDQTRCVVGSRWSSVPPAATTLGNAAGINAPYPGPENMKPKSPLPATTAIPGCT